MSRLRLPALWQEPRVGWLCHAAAARPSSSPPSDAAGQRTGEKPTANHQLWPVNEQREAAVPLMGSFGGLLAANQWEDGEGSAATRGMTGEKKYREGGTLITQRLTEVLKSEKCCLLVKWRKAMLWGFYWPLFLTRTFVQMELVLLFAALQ